MKKKETQSLKTKFRRSAKWKALREKVKKVQKTDPITGKPLSKTFNLHHLDVDPEHYENIDNEENFIGLNSTSHSVVHYCWGDAGKRKNWRPMVLALIKILKLMDKINKGNNNKT